MAYRKQLTRKSGNKKFNKAKKSKFRKLTRGGRIL